MAGAGSAAVSGAGTPVAGPAGRDLFAEGLLEFLRPAVQQLDSHVHAVRCPRGKGGAGPRKGGATMGPAGFRWELIGARAERRKAAGLVPLCRESQVELREQIDNLASELCRINEDQKVALDLDPYVKKLLNARRRVVLVNNILQNAQISPELTSAASPLSAEEDWP
ncbi:SNARE-associated protein Snapin isoform X2 [Equus przewalskii]|uniref:Biogenesis of lysosome-related organelles complex 1 subunit 7 n=1 Tax=Equus przewalskii TaxID=9798 RepID=A0ABM4NF94_EQUPR